jgi:hypothetical protein
MLSQCKRNANIGVGLGILIVPFGKWLTYSQNPAVVYPGLLVWSTGGVLLVWGCSQYAKGKGYSPFWGFLGLLYIIGFVVLFFFPDRHKATKVVAN